MVMVMVQGKERYMDGYLVSNLEGLKAMVENNFDGLIYVFGSEGSGKTTLTAQMAAYCDPDFTLNRMCWTAEQFMDLVLKAPKKSAIVFDEAYLTFTNQSSIGRFQKTIISMLTMIRKKNLFLFIVSPTIFDMSKYLVIHRARAAVRVYHKGLERGYFEVYGESKKLELYVKGRRDNNLSVTSPDFRGRFGKWQVYDQEAYEDRKDAAIASLREHTEGKEPLPEKEVTELLLSERYNTVNAFRKASRLKPGALSWFAEREGVDLTTIERRMTKYERLRGESRGDTIKNLEGGAP
jgi:hypothetical protein